MISESMSDMPLAFADLGPGLDIAYSDVGTGDVTLLMVHGMDSNRKAWLKNIPFLSQFFRCVAIDLPNHGDSAKGSFPFTASFFADVIFRFADQLQLPSPVLVGHSMGGQSVLRCLIGHPDRFAKAVLIAPAGLETFDAEEVAVLGKMYSPETIRHLSAEQIRKNVLSFFYKMPSDAAFMLEDRLALREADHFDLHCRMIPKCIAGMVSDPVFEDLGKVKAEVLVLFGENDRLIPHPKLHAGQSTAATAERACARIPRHKLEILPKTGHFLQWEQASTFNAAVLEFVKHGIVKASIPLSNELETKQQNNSSS